MAVRTIKTLNKQKIRIVRGGDGKFGNARVTIVGKNKALASGRAGQMAIADLEYATGASGRWSGYKVKKFHRFINK